MSEHRTVAHIPAATHVEPVQHPAPSTGQPHITIHMLGVRPQSPSAEQPDEPSPAKRQRLHQPADREPLLMPGLEKPEEELPRILVVLLQDHRALQLPLDEFDLVLQPDPTLPRPLSLPGHTFILVPESLLNSLHPSPGQPGYIPDCPQVISLLDAPHEYFVFLAGEEEESQESVPDLD